MGKGRGGVVGSTMQRLFDSTTRGNASTYLNPNRCVDLHTWGTSVDMDLHAIGLRASDRLIVDEWINFCDVYNKRPHIDLRRIALVSRRTHAARLRRRPRSAGDENRRRAARSSRLTFACN